MSRSPTKLEEYKKARKNPKGPQKRLHTLEEAAYYLGRSVDSMRELLWSGKLPFIQESPRGRIYLDVRDLDAYIDRAKQRFTF